MQPHPFTPHPAAPQFCAHTENGVRCNVAQGHRWHEIVQANTATQEQTDQFCQELAADASSEIAVGQFTVEAVARTTTRSTEPIIDRSAVSIAKVVSSAPPSPATHFTAQDLAMIRAMVLRVIDDGNDGKPWTLHETQALPSEGHPECRYSNCQYQAKLTALETANEQRLRFVDRVQELIAREAAG